MKALKRLTCVLLTLSLLFGDGWITSFAGLDFAKPLTVAAATVTDCYDAYDGLIKLITDTADAASQLSLKTNENANTRVKSAGNPTSPDMSTLWKINKDKYSYGVYKGYFTYEQKNIDAAAQVKSGKWLTNTKYESMTGTPTTEKLFFTMGGTQWIVDLQYRMVQAKYLRRYNFEAGARNYCYYGWGGLSAGISPGSSNYDKKYTTQSWRWDENPYPMTWGNAAFRYYEGYDVSLNTKGDKLQGGKSTQLACGKYVPTKDGFHLGSEVFRHDAPLSDDLTPNAYAAISVKKYLFNAIKSFHDGFEGQYDNYRADQGMSDPAYDDTGNFMYYTSIGWNYTYYFMARKSNTVGDDITSINGTMSGSANTPGWTANAWHPVFITYLYDWQMYHNDGGVDSKYPSATINWEYWKTACTQVTVPDALILAIRIAESGPEGSVYQPTVSCLMPYDLHNNDILQQFNVDSVNIAKFTHTDLFHTLRTLRKNYGSVSGDYWHFFDHDTLVNNSISYGYQCANYPMRLTASELGDIISRKYSSYVAGYNVDLENNGYNILATLYMYAMYYIFFNFGPMFYDSELNELFGDCPWFKVNKDWDDQRANEALGVLFGAVIAKDYNDNAEALSRLYIRIPLAAYPRGGDLDGQHTFANGTGEVIEQNAINSFDEKELFVKQIDQVNDYVYSTSIGVLISPIHIYEYGDTFCTAVHGDGTHCAGHTSSGLCCKTTHATHSPAPSGSDPHGNTYTSGCTCGTQYYTTQGHDGDGVGTCSSCAHSGGCPSSDGEDEDGNPIPHSHSAHSYHIHAASMPHHNFHNHYRGENSTHDKGWPLDSHINHSFEERVQFYTEVTTITNTGNFTDVPGMSYEESIGQLFTNVQWLDITSYQVWMMNRGQSKGFANILASPVTVDADSEILQTAVVNQKGFTVYNIDDRDDKEPADGLTTVTDEIVNLQARGRVANSFNANSYGNNELTSKYVFELANPESKDEVQMRACTLSFLANDCPAFEGQPLYSKAKEESNFFSSNNYTNGDVHAFMLYDSGTSEDDALTFKYNPYSQGGRSNTSFYGFVMQALAHTLYYPAKDDKHSPNPHPTRGNSYWVSYSNSLRIQGDYLGVDYLSKQATDQQTLTGYMYDTWDEKDVGQSCNIATHGHKYKLLKDSEEGYTDLAKYNVRCTWVPARYSYLMSRGPNEQIFGANSTSITSTNNCFMIHTFCRGINGNSHTCWDSIAGDSGAGECTFGAPTAMKSVTNISEGDLEGILTKSVYNPIRSGVSGITLKYWDNKTPYKHLKTAFKNAQTYNHKYLYATVNDPAPYVGYAADSGGGKNGTQDITLKGSDKTQQGYSPFVTNCRFNVARTMVSSTPYTNAKGREVSFRRFGVTPKSQPQRVNTSKNSRGKIADKTEDTKAADFSAWYPWLQELDLNRYLANDRYTTGSAQIEYESVAKHKDAGQNTVYAHTETNDVASKDKYYYKIPKFGGGYLTADKVIYVNAAYRRTQSVAADNFEGNPNDIVVYNPVSTQSAHVVPVSEHLPDAANVGATVTSSGAVQRKYTETYLQSFCTYVKRDSRIAYKYDLDKVNGDAGTEKVVNTKSLFLAHNVTSQEYTTEEYYSVSSADTTYSTASDHLGSVPENPLYVINNANPSAVVQSSSNYHLQYYSGTANMKSSMSTIDLVGGDRLNYPVGKNALFLHMQSTYSMSNKELVKACNVGVASLYANELQEKAITTITELADTLGISSMANDRRQSFISAATTIFNQWWSAQCYLSPNDESSIALVKDLSNRLASGYTADQLQTAVNAAINKSLAVLNDKFYKADYSSAVTLPVGNPSAGSVTSNDADVAKSTANRIIMSNGSKAYITEPDPSKIYLDGTYAGFVELCTSIYNQWWANKGYLPDFAASAKVNVDESIAKAGYYKDSAGVEHSVYDDKVVVTPIVATEGSIKADTVSSNGAITENHQGGVIIPGETILGYETTTYNTFDRETVQATLDEVIASVTEYMSSQTPNAGTSSGAYLKSLSVNFAGSSAMRKGTILRLNITAASCIDGSDGTSLGVELFKNDQTLASQFKVVQQSSDGGKSIDIYIEAIEDNAVLDAVTFTPNKAGITITNLSLETLPVPLLTTTGVNGSVNTNLGIDYYTSKSNWSAEGNALAPYRNPALLQNSADNTTLEFHANSFVLSCDGYAVAGNTVSSTLVDSPHTVISSKWKYYILDGWLCNGIAVKDPSDAKLNETTAMLQAPSGKNITVSDILSKIDNKSLIIYKTSGSYKLALTSDPRRFDPETEELFIQSSFYSTEDNVDYMAFSDRDPSELTITIDPYDLSFYQTPGITDFYVACLFFATRDDAIAYDVKYSTSQNHKYSPESPNYSQDAFVTTTTRYFFTEEAYSKIFGSYLSLDDEFTIYWDNYADLVNNATEEKEGTLSNVKLTHTVLGRGWDNRKDSQSNDDTNPKELKSSAVYSDWAKIKKYAYWVNMDASSLSKVTDCTRWIYTKYVIFNVDMYAFSEDKSYVYDDTKGPNQQEGKWDPTTPAFKEDGSPNHIVYIPAGSHVQLGYYKQRSTSTKRYGTNDDNGRFIDYGYRAFYNEDGSVNTPDGEDKYTKDPLGNLYTYHFWVPLSDGESDSAVTVQYVVNSINAVEDFDADANKDHVIDDPAKSPDTKDSLGNNKAKPTLSGSSYNVKQFLTKDWTGKADHYQTDSHSSAFKRGVKDEWGNEVINASGLQVLNNVLGVKDVGVATDANGGKYFTNKTSKVYRRANNTVNSSTVSIVGSIGNFAIVDVGDPRYQDTFKLSTTPDTFENYFAYPVVKAIQKYSNVKGEEGSQDYYMTDFLDVRGRYKIADSNLADMNNYSLAKHGGDTYSWNNAETSGSAAWYMATTAHTFSTETKVPNKHSEMVNDNQSIKVGYEQICTLETIGNYFGSRSEREGAKSAVNIDNDYGQTKLQIIPMYYAINKETGEKVNVDVYMKSGNTYKCINAGSEFATKEAADAAKAEALANGELVTEKHYYDGPYYLDNAYNNAYTYGLTTNTAGDDGSTYKLDQHMLRYSITAKEAEVTYDVVKKLAAEKNNVAAKNGIKTTILDYYDYSDKTTIGGDALDATYAYGNAQIMYLREYNRTFVGGTTAALNEELPTTAFTKALIRNAGMYAQKWYFGIKLPSSTVFVRHGETLTYHKVVQNGGTYTMASTDLSSEKGWVIYCRVLIFAIGDKYVLISHSKPSIDPDPDPANQTRPVPNNYLTTVTIDLDKGKSTIDLEGRGSH